MVLIGHYHFGVVLGRGKFGWVSQATHQVVGHCVAVKHQPWAVGGKTCGGDTGKHTGCQHAEEAHCRAALENEAGLLARISHPSVVALLEVVRRPRELYVFLEYLGEITLATLVLQKYEKETAGLDEPETACIFKQVAAGLHHLHCEGILHRDVKPENIMVIPGQQDEVLVAKLIDLGLAASWDPMSPPNTSSTRAGTVTFMAPELTSSSCAYGPEVDVFSLGASLYYALTGETPFLEYTRNGKRGTTALFGLQIQHEEALDSLTHEAAYLVRSMLNTNPCKRWTLPQICSYDWLLQEYIPPKDLSKSAFMNDSCDGHDIRSLFDLASKYHFEGNHSDSSEFNVDYDHSEDIVSVACLAKFVGSAANSSVGSATNSSVGSASRVRIRSLSSSSCSTEDSKDILINMECVDRVSFLLQKDNEHVLHHLGQEPWGPVGGIYNLLIHAGLGEILDA